MWMYPAKWAYRGTPAYLLHCAAEAPTLISQYNTCSTVCRAGSSLASEPKRVVIGHTTVGSSPAELWICSTLSAVCLGLTSDSRPCATCTLLIWGWSKIRASRSTRTFPVTADNRSNRMLWRAYSRVSRVHHGYLHPLRLAPLPVIRLHFPCPSMHAGSQHQSNFLSRIHIFQVRGPLSYKQLFCSGSKPYLEACGATFHVNCQSQKIVALLNRWRETTNSFYQSFFFRQRALNVAEGYLELPFMTISTTTA